MKTRITPALAIVAVLFSFLFTGCETKESGDVPGNMFYDPASEQRFSLDDQAQLNQVAILLAKEPGTPKILKDAAVVELRDKKGDFKAILVSYQIGRDVTKLVIPIVEVRDKTNGSIYHVVDGCEMKCTATESCQGGTHEIIERCASQVCACSGGSGGSSASIAFRD